jgi:metal transporter CNNM
VNSIFTIILEELTSGFVAVFCSTLAIVIIGEISPQVSAHSIILRIKIKQTFMYVIIYVFDSNIIIGYK